jgi:hypothetical protein
VCVKFVSLSEIKVGIQPCTETNVRVANKVEIKVAVRYRDIPCGSVLSIYSVDLSCISVVKNHAHVCVVDQLTGFLCTFVIL